MTEIAQPLHTAAAASAEQRGANCERTSGKDDVWEIITRFRFTRDQGLQAQLGAG